MSLLAAMLPSMSRHSRECQRGVLHDFRPAARVCGARGLTQQCWWQDLSMSRFVEDIRRVRRTGALSDRFRPDDVRRACPGWADNTYGVFLPKHRRGNPGGYTAYFVQHDDGSYSLLTP